MTQLEAWTALRCRKPGLHRVVELVKERVRELAKTMHPDVGGDEEAWREVLAARDVLLGPTELDLKTAEGRRTGLLADLERARQWVTDTEASIRAKGWDLECAEAVKMLAPALARVRGIEEALGKA